jgi:dTDP-4-dehydrorhamnose 3,5-epimerase
MKLIQTEIPDIVILEPRVFEDERGWFMESLNERAFHDALQEFGLPVPGPFVQHNHSCSTRGVLRGLHYQLPPHAQGKLVRVVRGAAYDVAVDLRRLSPTFGRWAGAEITDINRRQIWIPAGFGHGFLALQDGTEFLYKTTDYYARECERSILWSDPQLGIRWPAVEGKPPIVSIKDASAVRLSDAETFDS